VKASVETTTKPPAQAAPPKAASEDAVHISVKQQRKNDWEIIKRLSGNLWPKDDWSTRARVVVGMGLLVAGKVRRELL
jgi:ATP-binding cassette subfamily B (MDR/TAP) protein 7